MRAGKAGLEGNVGDLTERPNAGSPHARTSRRARHTGPARRSTLLLAGWAFYALTTLPVPASAASTIEPSDLEAFLHDAYYEVEFFVFERPGEMDFFNEEILTLNRARTLPRESRTQRLDSETLWTGPINPLTRACLTFPTLTYELLPGDEVEESSTLPISEVIDEDDVEGIPATAGSELPRPEPHPVPQIEPELSPDPQLDFLAAMAVYERTLQAAGQRWQPAETFQLRREAARVERTGHGRILFHGRWLQAVPPRDEPDPILVLGGERLHYPDEVDELVGTVGVTLGRYLHFRAELFFHAPGLGFTPVGAALDPAGLPVIDAGTSAPGGYMVLSESRRMRSTELHYLDHPKLGLVVRIDPLSFPNELVDAYISLEESAE